MVVVVGYENHCYNRDKFHGLGIALGVTATYTPPEVPRIRAVMKSVNLPVLQLTGPNDEILAYRNGEMSQIAFSQTLQVTHHVAQPSATVKMSRPLFGNARRQLH